MTLLPAITQAALDRSLSKYSAALGEDWVAQALDIVHAGLQSILNPQDVDREGQTVAEGESPATVRADLIKSLLTRFDDGAKLAEDMNLDFKLKVANEVARGGGRFVAAQTDVDEYPAWALSRMYDRDTPRGYKRVKGVLTPIEDDDWPARWAAAGAAVSDDDWLPWEGDSQTGRGVALKSSRIWEALGNGEGGYDDTLGNPFPPFAFNSGFDVDGVPFKECVQLGLLDEDDSPEPTPFDASKLFGLPA